MIDVKINNEMDCLQVVMVGIADDFGDTPNLNNCYDPKSKENVRNGTFPAQEDIIREINSLIKIFEKYNVKVFRPENIKRLNQIFLRDIAFVVDDKFCIANVISDRADEFNGITYILKQLSPESIITIPPEARIEGGDVVLCDEFLFVGYSEREDFNKYKVARTNNEGVEFLKNHFYNKKIKAFELNKSDDNPKENALHLDCCFQPIGNNMAIIYDEGFKNKKDVEFLNDYFGEENIIRISKEEMFDMHANIFSVSQEVIISEKGFVKLNSQLIEKGFTVEEIEYSEIAKMGGLLRCSTMPLIRR